MSYALELRVAAATARAAGAILRDHRARGPGEVTRKGGDAREPVSAADLAADARIRTDLHAAFPSDAILTEETPAAVEADRRWIVDPLDGTSNYLAGLPFWAVSIALEVDGECVLGVVHDPVRDELFASAEGHPATCGDQPLRVRDQPLDAAVASILLRPTDAVRADVITLVRSIRAARELGATALELAWVAAGRLDLCVFRRTDRVWDWAAGARLIRDAGGVVLPWRSGIPHATVAGGPTAAREICRAV